MRYRFWALIAFLTVCISGYAYNFSNETLKYVVSYKWGLVHKDAGDATLRITNSGNAYDVRLTGSTRSWADPIFKVRDTLYSKINKNGFRPISYTKISHEGSKYGKDKITYSYSGNNATAKATRFKEKKGKITQSEKSFTAACPAFDMGSIFYYIRTLDFAHLQTNKVYTVNMFSGSKLERLTIKYKGKETIKQRDGKQRECYKILLTFTTDGKKKSSDDISAWISTDSRHIPILVEGNLPIGKIRCQYAGG